MPKKRSKSVGGKAKDSKALDRPFDPDVLRSAKLTAKQYRLILEPDEEVGFVGCALELPNVFADGRTANECVRATREALTAAVATLLESGQRPPVPSGEDRVMQVNIRLTAYEKALLEEMARQSGRSLSDYLRTTALFSHRLKTMPDDEDKANVVTRQLAEIAEALSHVKTRVVAGRVRQRSSGASVKR